MALPNGNEFSNEALIATDAQPIFRQEQVLVFTPQDFQQPQRVYVQGVDDENLPLAQRQDGDQLYRIIVRAVNSSSDTEYNALGGTNGVNSGVFNVNIDNEANTGGNRADVLINSTDGVNPATTGLQTNENGLVATFTVVLAAAPQPMSLLIYKPAIRQKASC